jgi:hypothetical protein
MNALANFPRAVGCFPNLLSSDLAMVSQPIGAIPVIAYASHFVSRFRLLVSEWAVFGLFAIIPVRANQVDPSSSTSLKSCSTIHFDLS